MNMSNELYPKDRWSLTCRACGNGLTILDNVAQADGFFGKGMRPKEPAAVIPNPPSPLATPEAQETVLENVGPKEVDTPTILEKE